MSNPKHEVVNHSDGEIVNARGYSTNAIESKWGVVKRWIRAKFGGRLPQHHDRAKWKLVLNEFQYRKTHGSVSRDYDHCREVPLKVFMNHIAMH